MGFWGDQDVALGAGIWDGLGFTPAALRVGDTGTLIPREELQVAPDLVGLPVKPTTLRPQPAPWAHWPPAGRTGCTLSRLT